jgi:hypothetical protein
LTLNVRERRATHKFRMRKSRKKLYLVWRNYRGKSKRNLVDREMDEGKKMELDEIQKELTEEYGK